MHLKKNTISILMILLSSTLSLGQNTITYNLDGGSSTNPTSYEQTDIATTVTIAVYDLVNGDYVENSFSEDLTYVTGIQCQTWSRSKKDGGTNYNAATDVSFNVSNSSITWSLRFLMFG